MRHERFDTTDRNAAIFMAPIIHALMPHERVRSKERPHLIRRVDAVAGGPEQPFRQRRWRTCRNIGGD